MSCVLVRTTFWRSLKFFLVHQLFNSILQCSLRPLIRKAFCLWITDSRVVYLHMLWIHIWLPFNYFEPKCSPCSPKSGHTRWPALLAPGFVCLFLEFLPMKYRYFLFVEIWQLWTFKNIQNIPLRCLISIVTLMWFRVTMATRLWVCLWWYFQIGLNQDEDPPWKWEAPSHGLESQMEWRRKWAEPQPSPLSASGQQLQCDLTLKRSSLSYLEEHDFQTGSSNQQVLLQLVSVRHFDTGKRKLINQHFQ